MATCTRIVCRSDPAYDRKNFKLSASSDISPIANPSLPGSPLFLSWVRLQVRRQELHLNTLIKIVVVIKQLFDRATGEHGGCLIFTKKTIYTDQIDSTVDFGCATKLHTCCQVLLLICIYNPRFSSKFRSAAIEIINFLSHVFNQNSNLPTVICGDFNMPDVKWNTYHSHSSDSVRILNSLFNHGFEQLVTLPTHINGNTLDLIFVNFSTCHVSEVGTGITDFSDQFLISFQSYFDKKKTHLSNCNQKVHIPPKFYSYLQLTAGSITCYRPISLLSKLSLSFERVTFEKLYKFIAPKLSTQQFGFLKGRSTITQLLLFLTEAYYANEKNNELYAFYLDFAKAFDTLPQHLILTKLRHFGLGGNLLKLIHSYLIGRKQFVEINGTSSTLRVIISGVPQGSILVSLLFLVFIDNLANSCSESLMFLFANVCKSTSLDLPVLERDFNNCLRWAQENLSI